MAFGKLPDVINALGDNVLTNLTIGDAESLYGLVQGVNPATIEHISIDDTNFLYDCGYPTHCGGYYLYANDQSFKSLSHYVQDIFPSEAALADARARSRSSTPAARGNDAAARWASLMNMVGFVDRQTEARRHDRWRPQVIDNSGGTDTAAAAVAGRHTSASASRPTAATNPAASRQRRRPLHAARRAGRRHRRAGQRRGAGVPR